MADKRKGNKVLSAATGKGKGHGLGGNPKGRNPGKQRSGAVNPELIAKRREHAASMRLRGMTCREIADALDKEIGMRDLATGKPYSHVTIMHDLHFIRDEWKAAYAADIELHGSRIMAELQAIKRRGWAIDDLKAILSAIERECKMLGLDKPIKISPTNLDGTKTLSLRLDALTVAQLEAIEAAFDGASGDGGNPA